MRRHTNKQGLLSSLLLSLLFIMIMLWKSSAFSALHSASQSLLLRSFSAGNIEKASAKRTMQMVNAIRATKFHRIERIISNRGVGSRSEVTKLLKRGKVEVAGKIVRSGAAKFSKDTVVTIDGKASYETPLLVVYHKPVGVHSTMRDEWNRECLKDVEDEFPVLRGMHPVGRLDADTSGMRRTRLVLPYLASL
jgi:hypothetical protein